MQGLSGTARLRVCVSYWNFAVAFLLVLMFAAAAEAVAAVAPQASASSVPIQMSLTSSGPTPVVTVVNNFSAPLTAALVTVDLTKSHTRLSHLYFDVYANDYGHDDPVSTGNSFQIPILYKLGNTSPSPVVRAVIFADGTTWGDQPWVNELLEMRWIYWHEAIEVGASLSSFLTMSSDDALALVRQKRQDRANAETGAPLEVGFAYDRMYSIVLKNLDEHSPVYGNAANTNTMVRTLINHFDRWGAYIEASKPPLSWSSPVAPSAADLDLQSSTSKSLFLKGAEVASAMTPAVTGSSKAPCVAPKIVLASFHPGSAKPAPQPQSEPACTSDPDGDPPISYVNYASGVCGNQNWELVVDDTGMSPVDEGAAQAYGACQYGPWYDCSGAWWTGSPVVSGDVYFSLQAYGGTGYRSFGWNVDDYDNNPGELSCMTCPNCADKEGEQHYIPPDYQIFYGYYTIDCQ